MSSVKLFLTVTPSSLNFCRPGLVFFLSITKRLKAIRMALLLTVFLVRASSNGLSHSAVELRLSSPSLRPNSRKLFS